MPDGGKLPPLSVIIGGGGCHVMKYLTKPLFPVKLEVAGESPERLEDKKDGYFIEI